uniref:Glucuronosyltransferase n=1 Tax=Meloidogyne javanica TaxID=6303 RepID=A0A915LGE0_MELJA
MYAGVPLICVPWGADQPYNSSLIEHLRIGIYVKNDERFIEAFKLALHRIMKKDFHKYQKAATELKNKIHGTSEWIKTSFLNKIEAVIGKEEEIGEEESD